MTSAGISDPGIQLLDVLEPLHRLRGLLEPIDVLVDLLQRIGVGRPVEFAAGLVRDRLQGFFVHIHVRP